LKISLRAVQKKLAKLREKSLDGNGAKTTGHRHVVKTDRENASYQHGYNAGKTEIQKQLDDDAEKQSAFGNRIADLERENERLQSVARELREQRYEDHDKAAVKLTPQVERLKEFAKLAVEAFEIINGKYGDRLIGNPEGNHLVDIAKKAAAMKGKVKLY
jgi:vacuolar-type H+-ATPase subunit I/STV1